MSLVEVSQPVVLYDGVCRLCHRGVNFLLAMDRRGVLRFASLQSEFAKRLLEETESNALECDSIVLVINNKVFIESSAVIRSFSLLCRAGAVFKILLCIPPFIRDRLYRVVARNRYRWFGKFDSCKVPDPNFKNRFLD